MSAILKLLQSGTVLALVVGMAGCGVRATTANVSFDISRNDTTGIESMLRNIDVWDGKQDTDIVRAELSAAKESASALPYERTVKSITPSYKDRILEMRELNGFTAGWLHIPDTNIDDVILKNPSFKDNDYFLNVNFNWEPDKDGAYCTDYRAEVFGKRSTMSRITAIYGHSWDDDPNGGLFSQLKKYRNADFARSHPYIFFSTAGEDMVWEVFAVYDTTIHLPYIRPGLTRSRYDDVMNMVYGLSLYDYGGTVDYEDDKVLTLSTCTYSVPGHESLPMYNDYRFVIMARLVEPSDELKEEADLRVNQRILSPDATLSFKTS